MAALRGVNLGGWLVLERWITPSLFAGSTAQDEHTFCKTAGAQQKARLRHFRDTFITKQDFVWLADHGIQAVRLPVGHGLFGDYPPYNATSAYVDKACAWAQETGIKVLLDLHAAPGSQNGQDHSGRQGEIGWHHDPAYAAQTLDVIRRLAERYGHHPALLGFSLLNEPSKNMPKATVLAYYTQAYATIRQICGERPWIVYSDSYAPSQWRQELPAERFKQVYIDTHQYQVFSPADKRLPISLSLLRTRWQLPRLLTRLGRHHPVIVGEWSLALGNVHFLKQSDAQKRPLLQRYGQLQLQAYQQSAAWFYWTYRTDDQGVWSFRDCIESGLLAL